MYLSKIILLLNLIMSSDIYLRDLLWKNFYKVLQGPGMIRNLQTYASPALCWGKTLSFFFSWISSSPAFVLTTHSALKPAPFGPIELCWRTLSSMMSNWSPFLISSAQVLSSRKMLLAPSAYNLFNRQMSLLESSREISFITKTAPN